MGGVAMSCIKCGRETEGDQAFCPNCLEKMENSPVNPDVVIKLPNRQESAIKKPAPRKRTPTPEEQLQQVKKTNRLLIIILCLMSVLIMLLAYLSFDFFQQLDVQSFLGQNYSTVETTR